MIRSPIRPIVCSTTRPTVHSTIRPTVHSTTRPTVHSTIRPMLRSAIHSIFCTLRADKGNVESALTLIPLMILFLSVLQVGVGVYGRITADAITQGSVARQAMGIASAAIVAEGSGQGNTSEGSSNFPTDNSGDAATSSNSSNSTLSELLSVGSIVAVPLPGGGSMDIAHSSNSIPAISPLMPSSDAISSVGIAVQE